MTKKPEDGIKKRPLLLEMWKRLFRNKMAVVALCIVMMFIIVAIFANQIAPYDNAAQNISERLQFPSWEHPLGTDNFGRDLLTRIIFGARTSLLVALGAVAISLAFGIVLGTTAGYFGGIYENVVMRVMDILMAIPQLLLAVSISAALGPGMLNTALAISVSGIPSYVRLLRANVLTIRGQEYIEAAMISGSGHSRIIFKHILPNTLAPIIVDTTLKIGFSILAISGLSFIGLGVQPPTAEWGSIMTVGRDYIRSFYPIVTFPGIAIMLALFGFNLLGDGLRDALDPKLKH